jgi:hypothetical protein
MVLQIHGTGALQKLIGLHTAQLWPARKPLLANVACKAPLRTV